MHHGCCTKGAATGGKAAYEIDLFLVDHDVWPRGSWLSLAFESAVEYGIDHGWDDKARVQCFGLQQAVHHQVGCQQVK